MRGAWEEVFATKINIRRKKYKYERERKRLGERKEKKRKRKIIPSSSSLLSSLSSPSAYVSGNKGSNEKI